MPQDTIKKLVASAHLCCVHKSSTVQDAAIAMVTGDCSSLLVTDDDNQVIGIVTERDFTRKVLAEGHFEGVVEDICTEKLETLSADATFHDAVELMHKYNVRHLPVVEGNEIIGIVSIRDLFTAMEHHLQSEIREIRNFAFADTYGA